MHKQYFGLVLLAFFALGAGCTPATDATPVPVDDASAGVTDDTTTNVKEFTVQGGNFAFTPSTITVNEGDTVRITFVNDEGFHDMKIDEFTVATVQLSAGMSETVEFVADKKGTFEYYCSVGAHRANGMVGTLTVE